MLRFCAVLIFCGAGFAQTLKPVEVVTTNKVDLGPGGTIHIVGSEGELNVEAWEKPEVEVTVTRFNESEDRDRDAVKKSLDAIAVETKKSGDHEVTITTPKLRGLKGSKINYRIRAPKDAKLSIQHGNGDVVITGLSGGIDAHAKNSEIFVMLPPQGGYSIQARAKIGTVYSEYEGTRKHSFPFANSFEGKSGDSAKAVNLVTDNGGVTVQKLSE
jgi:hypothetical protein